LGGVVFTYSPHEHELADSHEKATRFALSKKLAALKGFEFGGAYDPSTTYGTPFYFVPSDALIVERAHELGIRTEHDLFGGVVPHAFIATKAISHPLVNAKAYAPAGWSQEFGQRVRNEVLFGFAAFAPDDARRAGTIVLERGSVRIKPVVEAGGRGQVVVSTATQVNEIIDALDSLDQLATGLVLEENLTDVTTHSVGQVRVADLEATYYGMQRVTTDNSGALAYGGSDLTVVRGAFDALLHLEVSRDVRLAITAACAFDRAAFECFPGLFASRRNYDVACGWDAAGVWRCGVLEQSWRIGGASGAEIAALEVFQADPDLQLVRASTFEVYGVCEHPEGQASVFFCGVDERVGPMTKYALVFR
jgi:Protein of unknown function (DUF3182)